MFIKAANPAAALPVEVEASMAYRRLGYRAMILDEGGYIRHIGETQHVRHQDDATADIGGLPRNAPCPCGSGQKVKHCHGALA